MTVLLKVEHLQRDTDRPRGLPGARPARRLPAVRDVSFEVSAGEIVAIAGEAGSGKTALARTLGMLVRPKSGKVIFEGRDLTRLSDGALRPVRRRLQFVFSDPRTALNPQSLVRDVMLEPLRVQGMGNAQQQLVAVDQALRLVGLHSLLMERRLTSLSAGQRQHVALARVLSLRPVLIICDNPTSTLPPGAGEAFFRLMAQLRHNEGIAFLWLVSQPQIAAQYADRLGILQQGRLATLDRVERALAQWPAQLTA